MDTDLWGLILIVLGGFLAGGVYAMWHKSRMVAIGLAGCVVLSIAFGALRLGYF
ncbi:hypothetical protein [Nocardiopsis sp. JB363]|uniref:hypothetical protein n=1 Tax=Nocardiopsis sp. JB363 TaxID=1434837 RepID=UPI000979CFD5|nr:hypothetical protein [Nocardiopsis sp. JB363]SIO89300.1 hypothetical protein BQ8420_21135 [Nocardiopsis sp. JB363]